MIVEDLMSSIPLLSDSYINDGEYVRHSDDDDTIEEDDSLDDAQESFPFEIDSEFGINPYRLAEENYRYNHELIKESFEKLCIVISLCFPTYILFFFIYKSI